VVITSAPASFHSVAQALKLLNDPISLVALNLNPSILDRSPGAKPGLQFGGKLCDAILV
jgi:hypothetical protein